MKLSVPTPPGWSRQQVADGELLRAPNGVLELLVLPLEGRKVEAPKWLYAALLHERQGVEPSQLINGRLKAASGWTAITVEADIGAESRFVAYFSFLDLAATVIATCADRSVAFWRDEVIQILYLATPDFSSDRITCLRELLGQAPPTARAHRTAFAADRWRRTYSGGDVILVPRAAPDSGWIRYAPGQTPQRTAAQLFSAFDTPPALGITDEGEYFAIAAEQNGHTQRALAIVFGAESYTRIEALATDPDRFEMFTTAARTLACEAMLGYGANRLRPYYYEPPATWTALPRAGTTIWISPTCSRRYHALRVFEACPSDREAIVRRRRFETVAAEFLETPPRGPAVYYTKDDLEVRVYAYTGALAGGELHILDAAVIDDHYSYPLRVECDGSLLQESMQLLEDVVRTIVPLPSRSTEEPASAEVFSHWFE